MKAFTALFLCIAACGLLAGCGGGGGSSTTPGGETSTAASSATAPFGTDVQYTTDNGDQVTAEYAKPAGKPNAPALMVLHQLGGSRHQWDAFAPQLLQAGYAVLAPDLDYDKVNQCAAGSAGDGCRLNDVNNLLAVVNGGLLYLQSREGIDTSRIGVIGASFGANLAYVAAGTFPEIDAAVALSPNARPVSGGLLGEGIVGFKAPHAILFAADGTEGPDAQTVAAKAEQPVEVKVYSPGKAHGVELLNNPQAAADVLAWLQAHL